MYLLLQKHAPRTQTNCSREPSRVSFIKSITNIGKNTDFVMNIYMAQVLNYMVALIKYNHMGLLAWQL